MEWKILQLILLPATILCVPFTMIQTWYKSPELRGYFWKTWLEIIKDILTLKL